ncbi:MAG: type II toxin-antitoxin system HipA family toxin [Alphaproteobacteria bacterium]
MAATLWGKVYYQDRFAGILQQEPGGRCAFAYDPAYIEGDGPSVAHTLPLQEPPHHSEAGLHPFFDNLVAEGWLRDAQARALRVRPTDRFAMLLAFGRDCAGAVSIIDPEPAGELQLDTADQESIAALTSRASLSGIQPKLVVVRDARGYRPAQANEISTHIAKLPSGQVPDIVPLEWLTTEAARRLMPEEPVAPMEIGALGNIAGEALFIRRFDRTREGGKLHFEEFNQLLGKPSEAKYDGAYEDMARFVRATPGCIPAEAERLFRRVLVCLLVGNTDAHLKNFAMLHTPEGLRLSPCYDLVGAAYYPRFDTIALAIAGAVDLRLGVLQPKHIVGLGEGCGLSARAIALAVEDLGKRLDAAKTCVYESDVGTAPLRDGIIDIMEKRWNGAFASIGQLLSRRRAGDEKHKDLLSSA